MNNSNQTQLTVNNGTTVIDALARSNNIIKSIFHFDKPITYLIVQYAIQKSRKSTKVILSKEEVKHLAQGKDLKIGIDKLIKEIKQDIEKNNFFNYYRPNTGLKNTRTVLVEEHADTNDKSEDLYISFRKALFEEFKTQNNYTIQSVKQLQACKEQQKITLYTLTQPYAKNQKSTTFKVANLKDYLRIDQDKYKQNKLFTLQIKRLCEQITKLTDIKLEFKIIKQGRSAIGYEFFPTFKEKKVSNKNQHLSVLSDAIEIKTSIRQQLVNWGVGKLQIDNWLSTHDNLTLEKAINDTHNRATPKEGKNSNPGGYIHKILGDIGPHTPVQTLQINNNQALLKFGLTEGEINYAKAQLINNQPITETLLNSLVKQCLVARQENKKGTNNMGKFFKEVFKELAVEKSITN